jgi:hypothetical protein
VKSRIKKDKLLEILRENRARHRGVFEASLAGYRTAAEQLLTQSLAEMSAGRTPELRILLSRPEDHTRDYDRIIRMLELDVDSEFVLDEEQFSNYVMDDWRWKRDWLRMSNRYASASTQQAYGVIEDED